MDNETIQELVELMRQGEISVFEFQRTLDYEGFDGDLLDFL